jgi:tetratricopeptide (TPR) repeat protein
MRTVTPRLRIPLILFSFILPAAAQSKLPANPKPNPAFQQAETAYAAGDLHAALRLYNQAAATDPNFYEAPLDAGNSAYKLGDYTQAITDFQRAIAIDPVRETAYRFLGQTLLRTGQPGPAEDQFLNAIVAEPYAKAPRIALKQWADATHSRLIDLPIRLPTPNAPLTPGPISAIWKPYLNSTRTWSQPGLAGAKAPPPRHTLAEETTALRAVLARIDALEKANQITESQLDPTLRSLRLLDKDGMLESWLLLDHWDQGLAQDYPAYRPGRHDLLIAYMKKYVVHPPTTAN